jgi:uncharacterized membrane-anchored protein
VTSRRESLYWLAILLGASIGDGMSQARKDGGLGLWTTLTSVIFLATILVMVVFLAVTRIDRTEPILTSDACGSDRPGCRRR